MTDAFHGVKIALLCNDQLLAYQRDHKSGIPNPGLWDLPGGGREGDETPEETAVREVEEEFAIRLDPAAVHWRRRYLSVDYPGHQVWFLAALVTPDEIATIQFGAEGERWAMMPVAEFLRHEHVVTALRDRLTDYMAERAA